MSSHLERLLNKASDTSTKNVIKRYLVDGNECFETGRVAIKRSIDVGSITPVEDRLVEVEFVKTSERSWVCPTECYMISDINEIV